MKRFGLFVLLIALVLSQSLWLATPDLVLAEDEAQIADVSATETAYADATGTASAQETAAAGELTAVVGAQQTQAAVDATSAAAALTQTAIDARATADAEAVASATSDAANRPPQVADDGDKTDPEPSSTPTYKNILAGDWIRVTSATVNVRSAGTTTAPVVAQVKRNQEFAVLEHPISAAGYWWIRIDMGTSDSDPRWLAANYVVRIAGPSGPSAPSSTSTPASTYRDINAGDTIQVNTATLNVRSGTTLTSPVVAQIKRGDQYQVLAGPISANGYWWVRIDMGVSAQRWIAANYVIKVAPANSPTPTNTPAPSNTPTLTPTIDPSASATPTGTATSTATETSTATATSEATATVRAGTYNEGQTIVVRQSLNVRSGPSTNNSILMVASPGTRGTVLTGNTRGGSYTWVQAKFGNITGWVAINYVTHLDLTTPTAVPGAWLLSVSLDCYSTPERITLVNSASAPVTIYSIRTHYDPLASEPFELNHTLAAKQTRSYLAGTGASGSFALTTSFILTNSAGTSEGVTIETSFGTISRSCPAASSGERWVRVDLSDQYMTVYQGNVAVSGTYVSTGKPGFATPRGTFYTFVKYVSTRMTACSNGECWDTPNVPYTHYYTHQGHALHGAYWHNQFGQVRSHGCVNLPVPFSEWLYYWLPLGARVVVVA